MYNSHINHQSDINMVIHYELIGSVPEMGHFRDTLPALIAKYRADGRSADGALIVACAAHFYGLSLAEDFETMEGLIDAVESMDQELEVR